MADVKRVALRAMIDLQHGGRRTALAFKGSKLIAMPLGFGDRVVTFLSASLQSGNFE
jgi:hypothetical protein